MSEQSETGTSAQAVSNPQLILPAVIDNSFLARLNSIPAIRYGKWFIFALMLAACGATTTGPSNQQMTEAATAGSSTSVAAQAPTTARATDAATTVASPSNATAAPVGTAVATSAPGAGEPPKDEHQTQYGENPFVGIKLYDDPYTLAKQAVARLKELDPTAAEKIEQIASQPQAIWLGEWSGNIKDAASNIAESARQQDAVPLVVLYNINDRDNGGNSSGGAKSESEYLAWIRDFVEGTNGKKFIVVLEPDAIGMSAAKDEASKLARLAFIRKAVEELKKNSNIKIYLAISTWVAPEEQATRLSAAGYDLANGVAINVSGYDSNQVINDYLASLQSHMSRPLKAIVDTSRNKNGASKTPSTTWCNYAEAGLGDKPQAITDHPLVQAFVWLKKPGESDGDRQNDNCTNIDTVPAGQWSDKIALSLVDKGK